MQSRSVSLPGGSIPSAPCSTRPATPASALSEESMVGDDDVWVDVNLGDEPSTTTETASLLQVDVGTPQAARAFFARPAPDFHAWSTHVLSAARAAGKHDLSLQDWLTHQAMPRRELVADDLLRLAKCLHHVRRGEHRQHLSGTLSDAAGQHVFTPLALPVDLGALPAARFTELSAEVVALVDLPMRLLLLALAEVGDTSLEVAELARALHMELQYGLCRRQSVEVRAGCVDGLKVLLNGVREGGAHLLAGWSVRAAVSALSSQPAALGLSALASASATLGSVHYLRRNATPQYWMQPMASLTALMGLAVVSSVVSVVAAGAMVALGSAAELPAAQALLVVNLARMLRQVVQTYTQSPVTASTQLVRDDGTPLNAHQQYRLNVIRDMLYVVSSLALVGGASVPQVQLALSDLGQVTGLSVPLLASGVNELLDGWNPDLARLMYACFSNDVALIPGTQTTFWPQVGDGLRPCLDQMASRTVLCVPADLLNAVSMLLRHFSLSSAALPVAFVGAAVTGGLGSLRGRLLSYMRSDQIVEENGARNPMGLLSAVGHLVRRAVDAVTPCSPARPAWLLEAETFEQSLHDGAPVPLPGTVSVAMM